MANDSMHFHCTYWVLFLVKTYHVFANIAGFDQSIFLLICVENTVENLLPIMMMNTILLSCNTFVSFWCPSNTVCLHKMN